MEDRLQDVAVAIGDVRILPVKGNGIGGAVPVPEAQYASATWDGKLLIERTVSSRLGPAATKWRR
jgi:hypothetical protein